MTVALYDKGRESFLKKEISWNADNIKVVLLDLAQYTKNLATDQFLSDIPVGARAATSVNLTTKTTAAGVADADDITFPAVAAGPALGGFAIYQDTGVAGTSRLIAYEDTAASGLPVTPDGTDITIVWDGGANKIFKL